MPDFGKYNLKKIFPKKVRFLIVILLLVVNPWFWDFQQGFRSVFSLDNFETIFKVTPEDIQQINTRRSYYPSQFFGKIFENKLVFYLDRYEKNFFQGLDLNFYFFANHPRERAGAAEEEIFFWFWLPIFLIGFWGSLKKCFLLPNLIFLIFLSVIGFFAKVDNFIIVLTPFLAVNLFLGFKILLLR